MSEKSPLRAAVSLLIALLLFGCDGADLCQPCQKPPEPPPPPPQTVKLEVDWQQLADALNEVWPSGGSGPGVSVNVLVAPENSKDPQTVVLEGWSELVEALKVLANSDQSGCPDCTAQGTVHNNNIHNNNIHHTTFDFRFALPWFNADRRSLFTPYVVFPEEAKFEDWVDESNKGCIGDDAPAAICPESRFLKQAMGPFLTVLAECKRESVVELVTVGFASSSGINNQLGEDNEQLLNDWHRDHIDDVSEHCQGDSMNSNKVDHSAKFNLLVANKRAANTRDMLHDMLRKLVPTTDAFDIKDKPWCSHASMVAERAHHGRGEGSDPSIGLINRRAEVRLVELPRCVDIDLV